MRQHRFSGSLGGEMLANRPLASPTHLSCFFTILCKPAEFSDETRYISHLHPLAGVVWTQENIIQISIRIGSAAVKVVVACFMFKQPDS